MKRFILLIGALILFSQFTSSQTVEITPFGGYVFPGTMNGSEGEIRFLGNAQYGGMISIGVNRVMDIDLIYNRSDTKADVTTYYALGNNIWDIPVSINYMHIGFTKNFRINPMVSPYLGFNLGACVIAPKEDTYIDQWFFSMGINGGAKIYFSDRVGIKLQAQLMMPIQGGGFSFYAGTGGSGGGVTTYATLAQFGCTGGLIILLGRVQ